MAEADFGAEPEEEGDDPGEVSQEAALTDGETTEDTAGAADDDRFAEEEPPADDEVAQRWYKHWQASYTKSRQRDRERLGTLRDEHGTYKDVLKRFYTQDDYALQVLRQRFPQLAAQLSLDGTPRAETPGTLTGGAAGHLVTLLQQKLGAELAFLAPALAEAMQAAVGSAIAPLHQKQAQDTEATRRQKEDELLAAMDTKYPGWEDRYGTDMQALDQFLASDALSHPKFGNKYELLYRLLNPDQARIAATREMGRAARTRIGTGRTGRPATTNILDRVTKAATTSEAFRLAAQAALEETG